MPAYACFSSSFSQSPLPLPNLGPTPPLLDLASPAPRPLPSTRLPSTGLCILFKDSSMRSLCQTHPWSCLCHAHDPRQDMASPSSACRAPPFPEAPGSPSGDLSELRTLPHPELTTPPAHTVHTNVDSDSNPSTSGVTLTSSICILPGEGATAPLTLLMRTPWFNGPQAMRPGRI